MENIDYGNLLSTKIAELRKKRGLTQDALAEKLGITFQAVSKWENGQSCPDIILLPVIAQIFGVHIDELFGREIVTEPHFDLVTAVPWPDDNKIRAVIYKGRKLMLGPVEEAMRFTFEYVGEALNVESYLPLICGDVGGDASSKGSIKCADVGGNVSANGSVTCADAGGNVSANGSVTCSDVKGGISANGNITCADIEGDVSTNGSIDADTINSSGEIKAKLIKCRQINGGSISVGKIEDYE